MPYALPGNSASRRPDLSWVYNDLLSITFMDEVVGGESLSVRTANDRNVAGGGFETMREIALTRTTAEWAALLSRIDVPHTSFAWMAEVTGQAHLKAVEMFPVIENSTEGSIRVARPPTHFASTRTNVRRHLPQLGEYTSEVLLELGSATRRSTEWSAIRP